MRCETAREAISALVDDEQATVPALRLAEHLDACHACRSWHRLATRLPALPVAAPEPPEPTGIGAVPYSVRARLDGHGNGTKFAQARLTRHGIVTTLAQARLTGHGIVTTLAQARLTGRSAGPTLIRARLTGRSAGPTLAQARPTGHGNGTTLAQARPTWHGTGATLFRARPTGRSAGAKLVRLTLAVEAALLTLGIGWPAWTIVLTCCAVVAASVVVSRWRRQAPEFGADADALPIELPPGAVPGRSRLRLISDSEPELPR